MKLRKTASGLWSILCLFKERDLKRQLDVSVWVSGGPVTFLFIDPALLVVGTQRVDTDNKSGHLMEEIP